MARTRADDQSPGDGRQPYSDEGGPQGHHARTHDVAQERRTRADAKPDTGEDFDADLHPEREAGHTDETILASDDKAVQREVPELSADELKRLSVLTVGSRLDQGAVYLDLERRQDGPFTAMGGEEAGSDQSLVAKRETDYELWDRLLGVER